MKPVYSGHRRGVIHFDRARRRGLFHSRINMLRHRPATLLSFQEVVSHFYVRDRIDRGYQVVPLQHIVGSQGRHLDFDPCFMPLTYLTRERWLNMYQAYEQDRMLPPVSLYKIGDVYFVQDGNHRVSVARYHGQVAIDAYVVELVVDIPLSPNLGVWNLAQKAEQSDFLEWTGLALLRPDSLPEISTPSGYLDLIAHINRERRRLGLGRGEAAREAAVVYWHDHVYLPIVRRIREGQLHYVYGYKTEADLYLQIANHYYELADQSYRPLSVANAIHDYIMHFRKSRIRPVLRRMIGRR